MLFFCVFSAFFRSCAVLTIFLPEIVRTKYMIGNSCGDLSTHQLTHIIDFDDNGVQGHMLMCARKHSPRMRKI